MKTLLLMHKEHKRTTADLMDDWLRISVTSALEICVTRKVCYCLTLFLEN